MANIFSYFSFVLSNWSLHIDNLFSGYLIHDLPFFRIFITPFKTLLF